MRFEEVQSVRLGNIRAQGNVGLASEYRISSKNLAQISDLLAQYSEVIVAEVPKRRISGGVVTSTCFERERVYSSFP